MHITIYDPDTIRRVTREQAERGASLFDSHDVAAHTGHTWTDSVAMAMIDQADTQWNMLAQVFGSYDAGMAALSLTSEQAVTYGFAEAGEATPFLNTAWQTELGRRRG